MVELVDDKTGMSKTCDIPVLYILEKRNSIVSVHLLFLKILPLLCLHIFLFFNRNSGYADCLFLLIYNKQPEGFPAFGKSVYRLQKKFPFLNR